MSAKKNLSEDELEQLHLSDNGHTDVDPKIRTRWFFTYAA